LLASSWQPYLEETMDAHLQIFQAKLWANWLKEEQRRILLDFLLELQQEGNDDLFREAARGLTDEDIRSLERLADEYAPTKCEALLTKIYSGRNA
jgi:hypothetical protein